MLGEILAVELQTNYRKLGLEDALRIRYTSPFVLNWEDGLTIADLVGKETALLNLEMTDRLRIFSLPASRNRNSNSIPMILQPKSSSPTLQFETAFATQAMEK